MPARARRPAPAARLRDRRRAIARQEILAVAREVLDRVGPLELTVGLVAADLGISKQALYHYFSSKDELLFEIVLEELLASAEAVHRACVAAPDGDAALEALIRTYVGHFLPRLELHRLVTMQTAAAEYQLTPAQLERIRPVNDLLYGEAARKVVAQRRRRDPRAARRLAFTAHLAAMGLLAMRAITAASNDPLRYRDDELVDDLCRTFRRSR